MSVASALDVLGFRVYVPDLPGFGGTPLVRSYTLDDYAEWVERFCEAVGMDRVILLGHSNGGRISIRLMSRGKLTIQRLILCNSAGIVHPPRLRNRILGLLSPIAKSLAFLPFYSRFRTLFYRYVGGGDYVACENNALRETFLSMLHTDIREELGHLPSDTLLIWGSEDTYTPLRDGRMMESLIPHARLVVLEGERHGIHLRSPEKLVGVLKDNL